MSRYPSLLASPWFYAALAVGAVCWWCVWLLAGALR